MQPSDVSSKTTGKVLALARWDVKPENVVVHREAIVGEKVVTILKDMFESWRTPKTRPAR